MSEKAVFIPLDVESGGIGQDMSILSAHLAICDTDWNILDELNLLIKPNDGSYTVTAQGLSVNKIDLIAHDKVALTYSEAGAKLREFLIRNSMNGKIKLIPMGKNVAFDILKINDTILGKNTWSNYVSYRTYDMTGVMIYLKRAGKLSLEAPDSLEGLARYMGIEQEFHTAQGDNLAGIEVMKRLELHSR